MLFPPRGFCAALAAAFIAALPAPPAVAAQPGNRVVINDDQVLEINGNKTFLIGFIMPPLPDGRTPDGQNGIDELADAGATFLRTGIWGGTSTWDEAAFERERAWQDAAARNGMHCLVGLRNAGSISDEQPENEAALRRVIERFKDHPGMGAYYGVDEPAWNEHPVERMEGAYRLIKELDPDHPVWICYAPRGSVQSMQAYARCGDAIGGDIYPISYPPGLHVPATNPGVPDALRGNRDISLVGDFTRMLMEVARPGEATSGPIGAERAKPVWMVLQICWSGVYRPGRTLRFPTFPEQRFMTYQAIINGARGVIYFGGMNPLSLDARDRPLRWNWRYWERVLRPVIEEIGRRSPLYPALVAAESALPVEVTGAGIEFCVREAGDEVFVLACRRNGQTAEVTFSGLPDAAGPVEVMFETPRRAEIKDGQLTDWFAPFEVHVYRYQRIAAQP
jgi:hypothetical protein